MTETDTTVAPPPPQSMGSLPVVTRGQLQSESIK